MSKDLSCFFTEAFLGCDSTLQRALRSKRYQASLKWATDRPFRVDSHVRSYQSRLHRLTQVIEKEGSTLHLDKYPPMPCFEPTGEPADREVVALFMTLGYWLVNSTRRLCLTAEMRDLAKQFCKVKDENKAKELAVSLYQLLWQFPNREEGKAKQRTQSEELYHSLTWWQTDRARQSVALFLPIYLAKKDRTPNCQGQALLGCAFALQAKLPFLRVNLLNPGADLIGQWERDAYLGIIKPFRGTDILDYIDELWKVLQIDTLQYEIDKRSRVDFHSSCAIQTQALVVVADPFASSLYQPPTIYEDPFEIVGQQTLPGISIPFEYAAHHVNFKRQMTRVIRKFGKFCRTIVPHLQQARGLNLIEAKRVCRQLVTEADDLSHRLIFGSEPMSIEKKRHRNGFISGNLQHCQTSQAVARKAAELILGLVKDFHIKVPRQACNNLLRSDLPLSCEYAEPFYATAVTTIQSLAVLNRASETTIREIAQYGCDQSILYLLAQADIDLLTGDFVSDKPPTPRQTLEKASWLFLHRATDQLVSELKPKTKKEENQCPNKKTK